MLKLNKKYMKNHNINVKNYNNTYIVANILSKY